MTSLQNRRLDSAKMSGGVLRLWPTITTWSRPSPTSSDQPLGDAFGRTDDAEAVHEIVDQRGLVARAAGGVGLHVVGPDQLFTHLAVRVDSELRTALSIVEKRAYTPSRPRTRSRAPECPGGQRH